MELLKRQEYELKRFSEQCVDENATETAARKIADCVADLQESVAAWILDFGEHQSQAKRSIVDVVIIAGDAKNAMVVASFASEPVVDAVVENSRLSTRKDEEELARNQVNEVRRDSAATVYSIHGIELLDVHVSPGRWRFLGQEIGMMSGLQFLRPCRPGDAQMWKMTPSVLLRVVINLMKDKWVLQWEMYRH